jgi:hypothetical protein
VDEVRLRNCINRDLSERGSKTPAEIIENFNLRQKLQHVPYTLVYASSAALHLMVRAADFNSSYEYKSSFWISNQKTTLKENVF